MKFYSPSAGGEQKTALGIGCNWSPEISIAGSPLLLSGSFRHLRFSSIAVAHSVLHATSSSSHVPGPPLLCKISRLRHFGPMLPLCRSGRTATHLQFSRVPCLTLHSFGLSACGVQPHNFSVRFTSRQHMPPGRLHHKLKGSLAAAGVDGSSSPRGSTNRSHALRFRAVSFFCSCCFLIS